MAFPAWAEIKLRLRKSSIRRQHWRIETGLHYRRDVTFHEDATRMTIAVAGRILATVHNLVLGLIKRAGYFNAAQARRYFEGHIPDKMFVASTHRGAEHGIAKALLETLLAWCRARGVREIYLGTTASFLAAHRFYDKNGFREIPRRALPASFPVMAVDTKFYARAL